jgi:hypothetical protein
MGRTPGSTCRCLLSAAAKLPALGPQRSFNGLIQHSFALRIPAELRPQYARTDISEPHELLAELMTTPADDRELAQFELRAITKDANKPLEAVSLLADKALTNVKLHELPFTSGPYPIPEPFSWAQAGDPATPTDPLLKRRTTPWIGSIAFEEDPFGLPKPTDFMVLRRGSHEQPKRDDPLAVSLMLCQLLAHRRSRLFGPLLLRRIFNVLLPYAILTPTRPSSHAGRSWIVQPSLSLFLGAKERGFRSIFSLTIFLVPVHVKPGCCSSSEQAPQVEARKMCGCEIYETVQAGWSSGTSPPLEERPQFTVRGPLCEHLYALDSSMFDSLRMPPMGGHGPAHENEWEGLTLRQSTEAVFFEAALRMIQGPCDRADDHTIKALGDRVLTSLSASRTSAVVVKDKLLNKKTILKDGDDRTLPGSLGPLMDTISGPTRIAPKRRYRLDRAFFDEPNYAIGVLPANRCVVVASDSKMQLGYMESALLQAGWTAYMVIGAATATGLIRALYSDIEHVSSSSPGAIAAIEREVVVDLHEIYDLDITWEVYKHRYRLLRDRLGITRDYQALQGKLQALSTETNTRFEDSTQIRVVWLTAAIVFLTFVTVILTVFVK